MGFGWIANVGKAVELPKVFWHPELKLPRYGYCGDFEEKCKTFPKKNGYYIHYGESDKFVCQPCLLTLIRRNLVPRIEQVELKRS